MKVKATGIYSHAGMFIPVDIHEIKESYGRIRYTIQPTGGTGRAVKEDVTLNSTYKSLFSNL